MSVKRIGEQPEQKPGPGPRRIGKAAGSAASSEEELRKSVDVKKMRWPKTRKKPKTELRDFCMLFYGEAKFGKTTFLGSNPEMGFLTTEPGTKGDSIFEFNSENGGITSWPVMLQAVKELERIKRLKDVGIDTIDEALALCSDHVCGRMGIEHPSDVNDFGKTWNRITTELLKTMKRIIQTGRGLFVTSHVQVSTIESATGKDYTRIGPSLTGKTAKRILAFVDFIWYGVVVRGGRRLVITDGDDLIVAGSRKRGLKSPLPRAFLLPEDETQDFERVAAAFRGEDCVEAAEASDIWAARGAGKIIENALSGVRTRVASEGGADGE